MKHQYFGDVNDYRKYGLLRGLQAHSGLRLGVNWMLTPDDGRSDGKFIDYLFQPRAWRQYDPRLFDSLSAALPRGRHITRVTEEGFLGDALLHDTIVPDAASARWLSFVAASKRLAAAELIFFDPDNGIEIPSCRAGRRNSSKYLMKSEIDAAYEAGQSLLIYQHFIREQRELFIDRLSRDLRSLTGCPTIHCLVTANVAFFLLAQPQHAPRLTEAAKAVSRTWEGQISPMLNLAPM